MAKSRTITITGRTELIRELNALTAAMSGANRAEARGSIMEALGAGAAIVADEAKANARAQGVPGEVVESIFTFRRLPAALKQRKKPSALAGIAKQETMREWRASATARSSRAKVAPGGWVAMSLAAMYEIGTSKLPARGFFGRALAATRGRVREQIRSDLAALIARFRR